MAKVSGIYIIINAKNGKIYIGQASNFKKRWDGHKYDLTRNCHKNKHLQAAWNKYSGEGFKFKVLEYCPIELLDQREQHYLDTYMPKGICYNIAKDVRTPGRGVIRSNETRAKISQSKMGNTNRLGEKHTEETRIKISNSLRGKPNPHSIEHGHNLSKALKGKVRSEAVRQKIRDIRTGAKATDEARLNMSKAKKGVKISSPSEKTRRKISESLKGRSTSKITEEGRKRISEARKNCPPISEETRQKMRDAKVGKTLSEEHRRKIGESGRAKKQSEREKLDND